MLRRPTKKKMERVYFVMPTWPNISKDEEPRNI